MLAIWRFNAVVFCAVAVLVLGLAFAPQARKIRAPGTDTRPAPSNIGRWQDSQPNGTAYLLATSRKAFKPISRSELNYRIQKALGANLGHKVVYQELIGEGPGAWNASPRYPTDQVNCILWIDLVLAETYGDGMADKTPVMDRLRYFTNTVSFGTRKHFLDHWFKLDPAPLVEIPLATYTNEVATEMVTLNYKHFIKSHKYPCQLYRMDMSEFEINYATPKGMLETAEKLPAGFYLFFGVASRRYIERYGQESGPMGLVHGMLMEIHGDPEHRNPSDMTVYHASTSAGKVMHEVLVDYVTRMTENLHKGYVVFDLDPAWDYQNVPEGELAQAQEIKQCEKKAPPMPLTAAAH